MRFLTAVIFLFTTQTVVLGQQRPYYSQYLLNSFILNPAVAGIENYTDLKASYRQQWAGINGAPVTSYFSIHGPLHKSSAERENPTSFHPSGENPRGKQYWKNYTATDPHAGVGLTILNDKTGPLNRFSITAAYAYHLPLSETVSISAGMAAGIQNVRLNTNELYFGQGGNMDPVIAGTGTLKSLKPDVSAGIWVYSANFFGGVAVQNIIPSNIMFSEEMFRKEGGKLLPHLFFTAGYRMLLSENLNFLPSLMIKYLQPGVISYDLNAKCQYRELFWAGASYRYKDGYAAMLGINVSNTFNIGYAYGQTTSALQPVAGGTHEIMLGFLIGNTWGDGCPRNVW